MLDGAPLPTNASIRDFQGGMVDYVVDAVEQALLLLEDMAELQSMRRHEIFLSLKRYLTMVCPLLSPFSFLFECCNFPSFSSLYCFPPPPFFFNLCFFLWQAVQSSFQVEEITNYCHWQMKEEEGRRNTTMEAFIVAEKIINEMKNKMTEVEWDKKSAEASLDNAERQAKG